ncbi:hypothetical protein DD559_02885 [Sphingomonas pokkalii]|uniref:Methyltransferase type 11 domain-containing protein n=1 Tax=Sphingomonas pokkalii TaxID=2175090 RepID=A0A2U0SAQ9_9SPHN|nr:hypothetical protein DD559_02885 [Sphingomonas pokkalii]
MDLSLDFHDMHSWNVFRGTFQQTIDSEKIAAMGRQVLAHGFIEPLTGSIAKPEEIIAGSGLREGLSYQGIASRVRAVLSASERAMAESGVVSARAYAPEAMSAFAMKLKAHFPRCISTEYTTDPEERDWLYPIPFGDLSDLFLESDRFDLACTSDLLEYVPSMDDALAELRRILAPGGWHIGTVSFRYLHQDSERRAERIGDRIVHHLEAIHNGPPDSAKGTLMFEQPGWDILDRARAAGFRKAFMRFHLSARHGILAEDTGGVFVLCCQK